MKKKLIIVILLFFIAIRPIYIIANSQDTFFKRSYEKRYALLKKSYFESQYVVKINPAIQPDQTIESYAAGAFLRGLDPVMMIHDHPPLGKYILSLSILLFDNENTIIIALYAASLFGLFLVSREVLKNSVMALFPVALFANEPLMYDKLVYTPIPELVQFPFIVFSFYFFLRMIRSKNAYTWAVLTSLSLGAVISIRFFVTGAVILSAFIIFLLLKKNISLLSKFSITLPLSMLVLIASYTKTILEYQSVLKPFAVQKYILAYHSSKFTQMFTVWDLLIFNRWHTWWDGNKISSDASWRLAWPISFLSVVTLIILGIFKKISFSDQEKVLLIWILMYGLMLSTGYTSVRYFLPWIPFFYILAFSLVFRQKILKRFLN